jgi:hypothetical protein
VEVESASLVLEDDSNAAQILLEGCDFRNVTMERPISGFAWGDESPKLVKNRLGNLNKVKATILNE